MVICVELSEQTKQQLDKLMEVAKYRDYSEAVSVAISNQLVLQRQVAKSGTVLLPEGSDLSTEIRETRAVLRTRVGEENALHRVPTLFSRTAPQLRVGTAAPLPSDVFARGQAVPVDRWIFGQHNKFLPAKASCRALASLLSEPKNGNQGVVLSRAAADIAEQAVGLGDYLRFLDKRFELSRDDAYSTAFPHSETESGDKARLRYAGQFVASLGKQGRLTGFLVDLKLINHAGNDASRILLTQAGWDFALLPNDVLDSAVGDVLPAKLNEEEKTILLAHITQNVPTEDFAYKTILGAMSEGTDTPEKLDAVLKKHLSIRREKPFTDAFLTTQRSGAISRMIDLGLIDRVRSGIRVSYVITERGAVYSQAQPAGVQDE
jgi:hypothetical protein